jgi:hypothetical protein
MRAKAWTARKKEGPETCVEQPGRKNAEAPDATDDIDDSRWKRRWKRKKSGKGKEKKCGVAHSNDRVTRWTEFDSNLTTN